MVDYSSLENYRAERHRGFESLSLRKKEQSARVALFVYAIRVLTFFQSLRFMKAPLRVEREYQMKPRGRVFYQPREKTIVRKASHWDIGQTWND